ncbi:MULTISPECIES: hypothetical protein [unclassified Streptomyces]|nr:hypothetical protein [Streptomyces sp. CB02959]
MSDDARSSFDKMLTCAGQLGLHAEETGHTTRQLGMRPGRSRI